MERVLDALRATAEPTRLRLLAICVVGELTVGELTQIVGQSQPRVSRHLKLLCDADLLERFREKNHVYYRLAREGLGRDLATRILELLPRDHATLELDRRRADEVLSKRAAEANAILQELEEQLEQLRALQPKTAAIQEVIVELVGQRDLGELLDIGTGTGRILKLLGPRAKQAVGIDISAPMLKVARSQLQAAGLGHISVRHGDMYQLAYPTASFDTITIDEVLSHADEPERVLAEAGRLLKPGGVLLVVDCGRATVDLEGAEQPLDLGIDARELKAALRKAGFAVSAERHVKGKGVDISIALAVKKRKSRAPSKGR